MDAENLLKVEGLTFAYGEVATLRGVDFTVPKGKVVSLMGRNGVGKTTLLKTLMGLNISNGGTITFDGNDMTKMQTHDRVKGGLGYVPQGRQIFPRLTVEDNLKIGLGARAVTLRKVPQGIYEYFPVLYDMRARAGGNLSGGQQQQLAIGRALATDPQLLLLDEPTEGIQPNIIQLIGDILQQLAKEKGMTILIVEQYLDFVREISSRFYIMNRGAISAGGSIQELTQDLVHQYLSV
ncbi:urea ABC transporter ATP-binding subunit UrtE [Kiritimatiellaeota bacterium B1221]|nr:urea ABC transporter ATP-binding subunit UrtE [Kiritimatiellaeota bacterium B1221]